MAQIYWYKLTDATLQDGGEVKMCGFNVSMSREIVLQALPRLDNRLMRIIKKEIECIRFPDGQLAGLTMDLHPRIKNLPKSFSGPNEERYGLDLEEDRASAGMVGDPYSEFIYTTHNSTASHIRFVLERGFLTFAQYLDIMINDERFRGNL